MLDADQRLFPEMSATVFFLPGGDTLANDQPNAVDQKKVFCPSTAIQAEADMNFVWVVEAEDRVQKVEVESGRSRDGRTEIISGLNGGERVVLNPTSALADAKFIRIVDENPG